jgi:hypothetical protein
VATLDSKIPWEVEDVDDRCYPYVLTIFPAIMFGYHSTQDLRLTFVALFRAVRRIPSLFHAQDATIQLKSSGTIFDIHRKT